MRPRIILFLFGLLLIFPRLVSAQADVHLATLNVQLWPEYDQPSMLVIHDFTVPEGTQFPVRLTFHFPLQAHLVAVAVTSNGNFINTPYDGPVKNDEWQNITITINSDSVYHFEYYEPLQLNGNTRLFNYLWNGDYAVDVFNLRVQEPVDMVSIQGDPAVTKAEDKGVIYDQIKTKKLVAGEQYTFSLSYEKSSDTLVVQSQNVQIAPIDNATQGKPVLSDYIPYILGIIGVLLIAGGTVYYFQSNKTQKSPRRRSHAREEDAESDTDVYCPQCGTRAKDGDRFCRTCGTKLRV